MFLYYHAGYWKMYISTLLYMLVYTTTYTSPKIANVTTTKSTPLMNYSILVVPVTLWI